MIEKRIFYIVSSCAIVLACWFIKNHFDAKVKDGLIHAEKRAQLTEYYQDEFQFCWKDIINKRNDSITISVAHDAMNKVENDMRQDGYNGEEIGNARSAGYKAAHEYLKWLNS
jgi:hypothetical protein